MNDNNNNEIINEEVTTLEVPVEETTTTVNEVINETHKKKSSKVVIIIIVVLIFIIIAGVVCYYLQSNKDTNNSNTTTTNNITSSTSEETTTTSEITTTTKVTLPNEEYASIIPDSAYSGNKTLVTDISELELVTLAMNASKSLLYENLNNDIEFIGNQVPDGYPSTINKDNNKNVKYTYIYKLSDLNDYIKKNYNRDISIIDLAKTGTHIKNSITYTDSTNSYILLVTVAGGGELTKHGKVLNTNVINEELIIEEKAYFYNNLGGANEVIYLTYDNAWSDSLRFDNPIPESYTLNETLEEVFNKTTSIKTYKHIFKKNTDGTYYWYSTEVL